MKETIKVLGITNGNTSGVAFFRLMQPLDYLNNHNEEFETLSLAADNINVEAKDFDLVDIIHIHSNITNNKEVMDKLFQLKKYNGIKIVMDIDDYFIVPPTNPYAELYNTKLQPYVRHYLPMMDYITTTTSQFKGELKKWTKAKIVVMPNWLNREFQQFQPQPIQHCKLRIGLLCGASHEKDIQLLEDVVKQLGSYNDKIQWVLAGFDVRQNKIKELSVWNYFEMVLTDSYKLLSDDYRDFLLRYNESDYPGVESQPYRRLWSKPINKYGEMYNHLDVLLAPLTNDLFNNCKSELKVVEAGNFGKVFVGSNVGAYKATITNGIDGILINNTEGSSGWVKAIKSLVDNKELKDKLSTNLSNMCERRYNAELMTKKRAEFYKSILK